MVHVDELEMDALDALDATREEDGADEEPPSNIDDLDVRDVRDDIEDPDDIDEFDDIDDVVTDDGDALPDDVQAELEALAAADLDPGFDDLASMEAALAETQRELERQQALTQQAVTRYREALLAAEPELPPDLVTGDTLEEIDASVESARAAVRRIRERAAAERPRGFPVGAPARSSERSTPMTAHEKIAAGLQERLI